jgi:hypothetical protein
MGNKDDEWFEYYCSELLKLPIALNTHYPTLFGIWLPPVLASYLLPAGPWSRRWPGLNEPPTLVLRSDDVERPWSLLCELGAEV